MLVIRDTKRQRRAAQQSRKRRNATVAPKWVPKGSKRRRPNNPSSVPSSTTLPTPANTAASISSDINQQPPSSESSRRPRTLDVPSGEQDSSSDMDYSMMDVDVPKGPAPRITKRRTRVRLTRDTATVEQEMIHDCEIVICSAYHEYTIDFTAMV